MRRTGLRPVLVCWSDVRWSSVFGRTQQVMMRWARTHDVYFVERPVITGGRSGLHRLSAGDGIEIVCPHVGRGDDVNEVMPRLLASLYGHERLQEPVSWYCSPTFVPFTRALPAGVVVYDDADDVPTYTSTHGATRAHEAELLQRADIVLTGGRSALRRHLDSTRRRPRSRNGQNVEVFASGVDVAHFARARAPQREAPAQAHIPQPRLGYFGVIDARVDMRLLAGVAELRPEWQIVLAGSVLRATGTLSWPRLPNLHLIGVQRYEDLPALLAGWDVAVLPFAVNEMGSANPTRVAECLAAGKPVVATAVPDVVMPYGELGLAHIASTPREMVTACERAWRENRAERLFAADAFLAHLSWDRVFAGIAAAVITAAALRRARSGWSGEPTMGSTL